MNIRAISTVLGIAAALAAGASIAQQRAAVARLTNVEGTVLVSQGDAMVPATNNQLLSVGTRVQTMAGARVVINYDAGCDIELKQNERFTGGVGECGALVKQVVVLGPASDARGGDAAAPAGARSSTAGTSLGIQTITGSGDGAYAFFKRTSVSPS